MRSRRQFSYPLSVGLLVATLVMVTGGWIAWWNYRAGLANARGIAHTLFDQVARQAAGATGDFLLRAPPAAETLHALARVDAQAPSGEALARRLLAVLRANPGFTWVSFSSASGAFTGVYRSAGGVLRVNQSQIVDGKTVLDEHTVADDGSWTAFRHDADTGYDPRTRLYYKLAASARRGVWTPPYVFSEGIPGITYVEPVQDGGALAGVYTIDFDLLRLSEMVRSLRFSDHGRVVLVSEDGLVLAHPSASLIVGGALVRAADLDDPPLRAQLGAGRGASGFELDGTPYLASSVVVPIPGGPAWQVLAYAPEADFTSGLQARVTSSLMISLAAVVVAVLLAWVLARRVSGPLAVIAAEMAEVGELRLAETEPRRSLFREIEMMNTALTRMKRGLRSFARYVPRDLVRAVLASGQDAVLAGDVRQLTVYFSDLVGFTTLAETLKPDELVRFLGEYFGEMSRIIADERGTVDKYLGDGIMAFWGAPSELADHAAHACVAALRCHRRTAELAANGVVVQARIGVATGDVLVGNIGSPERMNYTVMGDTVNLASRVESLNKQYGTQLMVTEETYRRAREVVVARAIDVVAVKGKQLGVRVYELLALTSDHDAAAEAIAADSTAALDAYLARDFTAAVAAWNRVLDRRPADLAATLLRDRALRFAAAPPPPDWNGVTIATEK